MDNLTSQQRSKCMARIKSKGTRPETSVRRALTKRGWKYRLHVNKLPGKPDIVIGKKKIVLFINGCFWHQHKGCKRATTPKTNRDYWDKKLEWNVKRQRKDRRDLKKLGWKSFVIWECETKQEKKLAQKLRSIFDER